MLQHIQCGWIQWLILLCMPLLILTKVCVSPHVFLVCYVAFVLLQTQPGNPMHIAYNRPGGRSYTGQCKCGGYPYFYLGCRGTIEYSRSRGKDIVVESSISPPSDPPPIPIFPSTISSQLQPIQLPPIPMQLPPMQLQPIPLPPIPQNISMFLYLYNTFYTNCYVVFCYAATHCYS